jgi:PAS domain S-box-containing protein
MTDENESAKSKLLQPEVVNLIRLAKEAIIIARLDGTVTGWNESAERVYGYTAEEIIGQSVSKLMPSDDSDQLLLIAERIRRGETIEDFEVQRVRRDGRTIDVSLTVSPIRDEIRKIVGVLYLGTDISERNRLERVERDQLFFASIVSSADDAIISKDLRGIVTSWNTAAEKIFGYTAKEMIGQPGAKLIPPDHGDEELQILERIRRGERIEHFESVRIRKDGRAIHVSLTISPIRDRMGRIIGASKIARDITERRRWRTAEVAQSFLESLVESADDAIISKTLDGIVTSWNFGAQVLFGYTASEMIGKPISILIPVDSPDEEPQILGRVRRGERIAHYETRRVRKNGSLVDVSLTVSPIRDSLGVIIGASKIARDITERKRAEATEREILRQTRDARTQAEQARQQAENANKAKDEFLANISHELRTPMTAILGWTSMLLNGQLSSDRQKKAFEIIDRNARSQAQLIEDLLDVSRIIAGKLRVDFKTVDMTAVITAAVEALRPAAEAKGIRIDSIFSSAAGPVAGDPERLQQVVWNLLSNAIKFTPRDGLVQIELRRAESQVELRVIDTGIGISPEFIEHVFDRFSQADASITRNSGGLGMGLSIVKSLIELHGGVVSASSPGEGQGASFSVKLPISAVRDDLAHGYAPESPALETQLKQRDNLVGLKLLIIEDEPDTCEMLRFLFNECGSIVETAGSANAALKVFDKWHPDILIADIGLPDVDGFELIRIIRDQRRSRIPAVALTAMTRVEDRLKVLSAGYQMHVSKPIEPAELITIVSGLVGLVERRTEL